ncbi:MAG: aspartate carbamoyltransferase [Gammaproteobacteria bacterium]|nr:MAG: aspartate carbamoyltransferase [Gammaproteobacteria bacterium]
MFHIVNTDVFDRESLNRLCHLSDAVRQIAKETEGARFLQQLLPTKRAMLYFTQPSTRTFLSMNNACHVLGVRTSEIRDPEVSSEIKGESFEDSIRTFSSYVDLIVMRTPEPGYAARAAALMDSIPRPVPIVNAGSGRDQHPTQALLDIYTLERSFEQRGGIDGKTIGMMGDLRRGRTVRSLSRLMRHYRDVRLVFIAPPAFEMEPDIKAFLDEYAIAWSETAALHEALPDLDALYVTRMQFEHDTDGESARVDLSQFSIGRAELDIMRPDTVLMHPLPRGREIHPSVDSDARAMYWRQERNGMWMRVALIATLFDAQERILDAVDRYTP